MVQAPLLQVGSGAAMTNNCVVNGIRISIRTSIHATALPTRRRMRVRRRAARFRLAARPPVLAVPPRALDEEAVDVLPGPPSASA